VYGIVMARGMALWRHVVARGVWHAVMCLRG
jgi:hypothetical protein